MMKKQIGWGGGGREGRKSISGVDAPRFQSSAKPEGRYSESC